MVDFVRLAAIVGEEYLQDFLLGQDAVVSSRELLRRTEQFLRQPNNMLGRQDELKLPETYLADELQSEARSSRSQ
ncbi:hypothetical protein [Rhizobium jaguaris]|uniref:Uncharacterized protein n=1 Tax=Rhizobium jaguaris TaxID=1312183 RepID=A0A387FZI4_9HYPH|nr:hypothetical protein [Rhizobium jaguaris]AYG64069.1 hypothetical protein CCGE525_35240 [Rhizobium jaguaris]